jgi:hypothetical protein
MKLFKTPPSCRLSLTSRLLEQVSFLVRPYLLSRAPLPPRRDDFAVSPCALPSHSENQHVLAKGRECDPAFEVKGQEDDDRWCC